MQTEKSADTPIPEKLALRGDKKSPSLREKLQQVTENLHAATGLKCVFIDASDPKNVKKVEF